MYKNIAKETMVQNVTRRYLLKYTGLGLLGGFLGSIISPRNATAQGKGVHSMSVHGHSMQIEKKDGIKKVERKRFHIRVEGKKSTQTWFHFAIPTPVILNGKQLRAKSVNLRFMTDSKQVLVKHIQVYDGEKRIVIHSNVDLGGELFDKQFDVHGYPKVKGGLGISIAAIFLSDGSMEFISAGCTFIE